MSVYVTNYSKKFHRKTLGFARFVEKRLSEFSDAWSNGSGGSPAGSLSGASVPRALRGGGAKGAATRKTPLDKLKRRAAGGAFFSYLWYFNRFPSLTISLVIPSIATCHTTHIRAQSTSR